MFGKIVKKAVKAAVIGGALLGLVGAAQAATYEVNIYGASAQYKFWRDAAPEFLKSMGCSESDIYAAKGEVSNRDNGIAVCAGSDVAGMGISAGGGFNGDGNTYIIRYSTNASYDGIRSVQDLNPDNVDPVCTSAGDGFRLMADETNTAFAPYFTQGYGTVNGTACKDITIGASDVAAETFNQSSQGALLGPGGGDWTERNIGGLSIDASHYVSYRPVVVPFAFFANANPAHPVPFDNMSRLMAVTIFSGQVPNWNKFNPDLDGDGTPNEPGLYTVDPATGQPTANSGDSLPMIVCLRHAGSGTHATLDAAVMRKDAGLLQQETTVDNFMYQFGMAPAVYFNKGSSDEMRCVGGYFNGYDDTINLGQPSWAAVGYADADKNEGEPVVGGEYGDIKRMTFQGVAPVKVAITNGQYDFWSAQWLYRAASEPQEIAALCDAIGAFASDPANLPAGHADYWAAQNEMQVEKNNDFTYPKFK